jgi:outer membrane protein OmpA-like peptidoglycan-associated protein/tetratricopeptide (TPR) repeat protein
MKILKTICQSFSIVLLLLMTNSLAAQSFVTKENASKKALSLYQQASLHNRYLEYQKAISELDKAIDKEPTFIDAILLRADSYYALQDFANAEKNFEQILAIAPEYNLRIYYAVSIVEQKQEKFDEAVAHLETFLTKDIKSEDLKNKVKELLRSCQFGAEAVKKPSPFQPKNLGENINTPLSEYLPALTADSKTLIFTKKLVAETGYEQEDFYVSQLQEDGSWSVAKNLGEPINTYDNEGAETISADGKFLVYTVCNRPKDFGSCDLYFSVLKNGQWTRPQNMGADINTQHWESQPSLSADGNTLYFSSGRPGGKGEKDIWMSKRNANGTFSKPVSININSSGNEECPFIHSDNETLYFTSTGYLGMGGADLFMSKKQTGGTWGEPIHLGYPINSANHESALIISIDGKTAYFASNKNGGFGGVDLYSFEMPEQFRPKPVTYIKGTVYHAQTKAKLSAEVAIANLELDENIQVLTTNADGEFLICLPAGIDYRFGVEKEGFLFHSENFALKEASSIEKPFLIDIPLQPIPTVVANTTTSNPAAETSKPVILKNVFFETGSAILQPISKTELQVLLDFLNANPTLNVQINGHTDNVGAPDSNLKLSTNRAQAVVDYLIKNGIGANRLRSKGFGETSPIDTNDTPDGRQNNRRTEFVVF